MLDHYPPLGAKLEKFKAELALIARRHREDATQEAWVAHLEGRDAIKAIKAYSSRESWHERREIAQSQV